MMPGRLAQSAWLRVTVGSLVLTVLFIVFYGAVPSAIMVWTDGWPIVEDNPELGPRIRDAVVMGYHGAIVGATFLGFSLYQRLNPVNADADEAKRDPGGYR